MKAFGVLLALLPTLALATPAEPLWIGLAHGSEREAAMASALRAAMREHDLEPWLLTRKVLVDERQIPHSHPVLTVNTRHRDDRLGLLSMFVHEQLHWLEEPPTRDAFHAAMADFEALFPEVPGPDDGGARDRESTYRHLLVCDMELQAMTTLVGEAAARETLAGITTHYQWIYAQVLKDPRVREVVLRHGFDVSEGIIGGHGAFTDD